MDLSALAASFREIEGTSERRRMTTLVAELFRRDPDDAAILAYLIEGRLGPPWDDPSLGLDERRIALALARAAGVPEATILERNRALGDLGRVAEEVLPPRGEAVSVREAYERLLAVARATGPGSTEEKLRLLQGLLARLGGPEAWALIRLALRKLRLGVADALVMDALSVAATGDAKLRPRIERAFSVSADLGFVAQTLLTRGPAALDAIEPTPGRPVLPALAERLPSAAAIVERLGTVLAEPKYDGLRLQAHRVGDDVILFTRNLEDVTAAFPDVADAVREQVAAREAILDGEAVGYDPATDRFLPFQQTMRRRRKHGVEEMTASHPLRYFVFDALDLDGRDLLPLPQRERSRMLREIVRERPGGIVAVTPQIETNDPAELERYFAEQLRQGLEGVVAKRPDVPYSAGARGFGWVKLKPGYDGNLTDTFDLVVVGYDRGRGKRAKLGIGSLLCAVYDRDGDRFRTITRLGTGLSDEEWAQMRAALDAVARTEVAPRVDSLIVPDVWTEPSGVVEVAAAEITRSPLHTCGKVDDQPGYALRFPRLTRFRPDRRPEDATTQAEVLEMYHIRAG